VTDEPSYTPEEIERGEDRAWHIPVWGFLGFLIVIAVIVFVIWRAVATSTDF
jgi:hypothetical protein